MNKIAITILVAYLIIAVGLLDIRAQENNLQKNDFLVDSLATPETVSLFKNLKLLNQDKFMFGHQSSTAYGVGWNGSDNRSDIKSVCGDYPAVYGWDLGDIGKAANLDGVSFERMKKLIIDAYERGGINTISMHLDNPVTNRNSWDNTTAVKHILPSGSNHNKFINTLKLIADFLKDLQTIDGIMVPVIFRPFHEHNQVWPWWGKSACTPQEFNALWEMMVKYLRDDQNVHNLLYTISPQDVYNKSQYFEIYPGDKWVDVFGMDNYKLWNTSEVNHLGLTLDIINKEAKQRGKLVALTEVGIENVTITNWWTDYLLRAIDYSEDSRKTSFALVWRNKSVNHFFAPYPGHSSVDNFNNFYSNERTQFENDLPDMYSFSKTETNVPNILLGNNSKNIFSFPIKINLTTNEQTSIRYSLEDELYENMPFKFNISNGGIFHETELNITQNGDYKIFFRAMDLNENKMDTSYVINVSVDTSKRPIYWTELEYNDSSWSTANAPLGFGDEINTTVVEQAITTYYRSKFNLNQEMSSLGLLLKGHDGIAAYINGKELGRVNLNLHDNLNYNDFAESDGKVSKVMVFNEEQLSNLKVGENILAIEVHQFNSSPADISIDARIFNNQEIVFDLGSGWNYYDRSDSPNIQIVDKITDVLKENVNVPNSMELYQNYPNPFNPTTTIKYTIPDNSGTSNSKQGERSESLKNSTSGRNDNVKLIVYDVLGREIATLLNGVKKPGNYEINFNSGELTSGVYFYNLSVGNKQLTKKMIIMK